jgi:hypothetical protein
MESVGPRAGPEVRDAKFAEGWLAAIGELQRQIRGGATTDVAASAREMLEAWEHDQLACQRRGVAWSAYRDGGVDALRRLVDELGEQPVGT